MQILILASTFKKNTIHILVVCPKLHASVLNSWYFERIRAKSVIIPREVCENAFAHSKVSKIWACNNGHVTPSIPPLPLRRQRGVMLLPR